MLDKIKVALRITHNFLDDDINDTINSARAEMVRSGILEERANDDEDMLIVSAIKTYCLSAYCSDMQKADGYRKSWEYQLECLRKSIGYMKECDV
jgi:uncharacterized phage protein (predicted DNA packaging)